MGTDAETRRSLWECEGISSRGRSGREYMKKARRNRAKCLFRRAIRWLRGQDLNLRPSGYEPEMPRAAPTPPELSAGRAINRAAFPQAPPRRYATLAESASAPAAALIRRLWQSDRGIAADQNMKAKDRHDRHHRYFH